MKLYVSDGSHVKYTYIIGREHSHVVLQTMQVFLIRKNDLNLNLFMHTHKRVLKYMKRKTTFYTAIS